MITGRQLNEIKNDLSNLFTVSPSLKGSSQLYATKLREKYLGDVPIYSPFYGATEGLIGVNLWPEDEVPLYMLVPRAMFFEFIPVEDSGQEQPAVSSCYTYMYLLRS